MATTTMNNSSSHTTTKVTRPLEDTFRALNDELEKEAMEYQLNEFYLSFDDSPPTDNRLPSSSSITTAESTKDHPLFDEIPDYLSADSSPFHLAFFCELRSLSNPIDFRDLQQLTFLAHQMSIINLHQQLWRRFLQVGTGELKRSLSTGPHHTTTTLSFWPEIVTSVMMSQVTTRVHRQTPFDQDVYIQFVQNYLHRLENKFKQCRLRFDTIKTRLPDGYTDALDDKIDRFVRNEGFVPMRLHFQIRIDLLECTIMDRYYQVKFWQQNPTDAQLEIANRICSLTFDKEMAEQEVILLQWYLRSRKLPRRLHQLETSPPTSITTLSDPVLRERLSSNYQRILQRAKVDLMDVLTKAGEAKRTDCRKNMDRDIAAIWQNQRRIPADERLTTAMLTAIDQRVKNYTDGLASIYHLKSDFLVRDPPIMTTVSSKT